MKKILLIFLFLTTTIFAQLIEPLPVEVTQQSQMNYQIYILQKVIDNQFNESIKNGLEPPIIKIDKENVIIKDNKAIVNIEVYSNNSNEKIVLKNQELVFKKDNLLELEEYPLIIEKTISKERKVNKENNIVNSAKLNKTTSETTIDIRQSESVFVPYPIYQNGIDVYEIDYGLTKDEHGIQLLAAGAEIDGCVYYEFYTSDDIYKRIAFYLDPDWKRIVFSYDLHDNIQGIYEYSGDENITFERPIAIDVNEAGEIFVLDAEAKAVFKLQYNSVTNTITSTAQCILIDTNLENPSDLSYSNRGTYGATNDDFIVITDLGKKSVMIYSYTGELINEFTQYEGVPISDPKRVVAYPYWYYKLFAFIDGKRIVRAIVNNSTLDAIYSDLLPLTSNLTDIGITAGDYGLVEGLVVTDKNLNMLHYFDDNADYICSYSGPGSYYMITPLRVFNTTFAHYGMSNKIKLDFYTMDMWSRDRGIKKFVPGADVLDINVSRGNFKWILRYDETNRQTSTEELRDAVTNTLICSNTNYAYDNELIPGREYKWIIKYQPYYDSYYVGYQVGEKTKEVTFTHNQTMPSNIEGNYTIAGTYTASNDVTITNWGSLTLEPGTSITFQNSSSLIVDGTLIVNGISSNNVILDFQSQNSTLKNGIKVNPGGTANISHAIVKNAYNGVYVNEGVVDINNCEIFDCYYGVHLYRTNYVSYPSSYVTNTHSHDNEFGVVMYYSKAHLSYNEFNNNWIGVGCADYSSPYLAENDGDSESIGQNNIHNNDIGVFAYGYSNPRLGRINCTSDGGKNIIMLNEVRDFHTHTNCTVYAEGNYWGGGAPVRYVSSGCFFDYTPYLTSQPQISQTIVISPEEEVFDVKFNQQLGKSNSSTDVLELTSSDKPKGFDDNWPIEWKLLYARNLINVRKYNSASTICEDVINNFPDSSLSYLALDLLHQSRVSNRSKSLFSQFVKEKANKKSKKQIYGSAELLLAGGEKKDRVAILDGIAEKYNNTPLVEFVLFQKFMYYLYEEDNLELAEKISEELSKMFPKSQSYLDSQIHLGKDVKSLFGALFKTVPQEDQVINIPESFELLGNYPNPFNPSTTISYGLPKSSDVKIMIYDITGTLIREYVINSQSSGYHNTVWDGNNQQGTRVSSGVYFYRFKARSLENDIQVYEKTAKMLLLK